MTVKGLRCAQEVVIQSEAQRNEESLQLRVCSYKQNRFLDKLGMTDKGLTCYYVVVDDKDAAMALIKRLRDSGVYINRSLRIEEQE